jgi:hypothetical protein
MSTSEQGDFMSDVTKSVSYIVQVITSDGQVKSSTREAVLTADGNFTYGIIDGAYIEERLVKDALMEQARLFDHQVRDERAVETARMLAAFAQVEEKAQYDAAYAAVKAMA